VTAVFTRAPEAGESLFTVNGLNTVALDAIVAANPARGFETLADCFFVELPQAHGEQQHVKEHQARQDGGQRQMRVLRYQCSA
jgi:hypothetical protein